jgi:hypothetical protein
MTYERLFYLKFKLGISTYELVRRFPNQIDRVSEVALLDVPEETLKQLLKKNKAYSRLMKLKRKFAKLLEKKAERP